MLKGKLFLLLPVLAMMLLFSSCKKDNNPVGPSSTKFSDYLPVTVDTYWDFESYETDSLGNRLGNPTTYRVKVKGPALIDGKQCTEFIQSDDGFITQQSTYLYIDGSKVWSYGLGEIIGQPKWFIMGDLQGTSWDIATVPLDGFEIEGYQLKGTMKITGSKGTTKKITVKGKSIDCQEFKMTISITGSVDYMGVPVALKSTVVAHSWVGFGVGLVQTTTDPTKVEFSGLTTYQGGSDDILVDYLIK